MSDESGYKVFVSLHHDQLESFQVPTRFWRKLHEKCSQRIFDAGQTFSFEEIEDSETDNISNHHTLAVFVAEENGISAEDGNQIYLIDHACVYILENVEFNLKSNKKLLERMALLMNIHLDERQEDQIVKEILQKMWKFNHPYDFISPESSESKISLWYLMDELGSRIRHAVNPSVRVVPFYNKIESITLSLLFPVKDLEFGDEVTRNYVEGQYEDELTYTAAILPWQYSLLTHIDCCPEEPQVDFIQSYRVQESLPDDIVEHIQLDSNRKLKVYSDYCAVNQYLHHPGFEITSTQEEADIWWLYTHFKKFKELTQTPHRFINQFPREHILTSKDLLPVIARQTVHGKLFDDETLISYPLWLPTTYNLKTESYKFVSYFQRREQRGLDNLWICKPWNLARGKDIVITENLDCLLRLRSAGPPKVACKYITNPVLFPVDDIGLVKMDIRFIVMLKSIKPFELYVYKNFWLRFANKTFELNDFHDYEKHFTVMNYCGSNLKQMFCDDFIQKFESYYSQYKWADIQADIYKIFKELFSAAAESSFGVFHNIQSRAMYGIDLMLEWQGIEGEQKIQPMILEVNWAPDCERACQYYPSFYDDIFEVLFLDKENSNVISL